jgi:cytochrome c553
LLTQATSTSFHVSSSGFTAAGIVRGQQTYQQHCLRCHGVNGRGEGPDAPALAMWPPTLNGALLWKRMEGELFWRVRHGLQGRDGRQTMPGFAQQLSAAQTWEVLDFLQAQAAGQNLKESGIWAHPVRMPDAPVRCLRANGATVRSLAGQRLRVVVPVAGAPALLDDPRLVGLQLRVPKVLEPKLLESGAQLSSVQHALPDPECDMSEPAMAASLSLILGVPVEQLPGYQIMVDRQGWLRAVGRPGQSGWSEDDLVCRSGDKLAPQPTAEGLDGLIGRMDGEPVRLVRGGFPH